jgi:hypothetical protein
MCPGVLVTESLLMVAQCSVQKEAFMQRKYMVISKQLKCKLHEKTLESIKKTMIQTKFDQLWRVD